MVLATRNYGIVERYIHKVWDLKTDQWRRMYGLSTVKRTMDMLEEELANPSVCFPSSFEIEYSAGEGTYQELIQP